ncbi:MAG TPA: hypothetical protein PKL52_02715 [Tenuifilaceae bacterium]|nr:hypothetical protein [Tenuifilaceae bacterium]
MDINRDNYEIFFVDYMDGKLSSGDVNRLMAFLTQNPDLAEELEGLMKYVLDPVDIQYSGKEGLKKSISQGMGIDDFDYLCIANGEGELTPGEQSLLNEFLTENPQRMLDYSLFQKAKLEPDLRLVCNSKPSLKRNSILKAKQSTVNSFVSIAAGIALVFGLYSVFSIFKQDGMHPELIDITETITLNNMFEETDKEEYTVKSVDNSFAASGYINQTKSKAKSQADSAPEQHSLNTEQPAFSYIEPRRVEEFKTRRADLSRYDFNLTTLKESRSYVNGSERVAKNSELAGNTRTIGAFDLAQLGLQKISDYTGSPIELSAEKASDGTLKTIRFESTLFAFSTNVRKIE